jgi:HK97 family phage prohead protease
MSFTPTKGIDAVDTDGLLWRTSSELEVVGRTLEGLAMPFDSWAMVRDLSGPAYPEAHARSSFDESLRRDPGPRPLYATHDYAFDPTAEPIGVAHFMRAENAMMFRAFLSNTRKANEQRELIKDGAKRAVSVGFIPLHSRKVRRPEGMGRLRVESKLRELSIAPTGFGQYPAAKVLAMRAAAAPGTVDSTDARERAERERIARVVSLRAGMRAVAAGTMTRADFRSKWPRVPLR